MPDKRSIPFHRWLFGLAIILTVSAAPHAIAVYAQHLPTALLNFHLVTTAAMWPFAELRRQWAARVVTQSDLTEIALAAEHARR